MSAKVRWKVLAVFGAGAFALALYSMWKALAHHRTSGDVLGTVIFGCAALGLLLTAGLHWYMAAAFRFGEVDLVTGSLSAATLRRGNRVVLSETTVQFVRRLEADDVSVAPNDRYVFFISAYRPWVCREAQFKVT